MGRGTALATLLDGAGAGGVAGEHPEVVAGAIGQPGHGVAGGRAHAVVDRDPTRRAVRRALDHVVGHRGAAIRRRRQPGQPDRTGAGRRSRQRPRRRGQVRGTALTVVERRVAGDVAGQDPEVVAGSVGQAGHGVAVAVLTPSLTVDPPRRTVGRALDDVVGDRRATGGRRGQPRQPDLARERSSEPPSPSAVRSETVRGTPVAVLEGPESPATLRARTRKWSGRPVGQIRPTVDVVACSRPSSIGHPPRRSVRPSAAPRSRSRRRRRRSRAAADSRSSRCSERAVRSTGPSRATTQPAGNVTAPPSTATTAGDRRRRQQCRRTVVQVGRPSWGRRCVDGAGRRDVDVVRRPPRARRRLVGAVGGRRAVVGGAVRPARRGPVRRWVEVGGRGAWTAARTSPMPTAPRRPVTRGEAHEDGDPVMFMTFSLGARGRSTWRTPVRGRTASARCHGVSRCGRDGGPLRE